MTQPDRLTSAPTIESLKAEIDFLDAELAATKADIAMLYQSREEYLRENARLRRFMRKASQLISKGEQSEAYRLLKAMSDQDCSREPADNGLLPYQRDLLTALHEGHGLTTRQVIEGLPAGSKRSNTRSRGWAVRGWLLQLEKIDLVASFKQNNETCWRRTYAGTAAVQPNKHPDGTVSA